MEAFFHKPFLLIYKNVCEHKYLLYLSISLSFIPHSLSGADFCMFLWRLLGGGGGGGGARWALEHSGQPEENKDSVGDHSLPFYSTFYVTWYIMKYTSLVSVITNEMTEAWILYNILTKTQSV